MNPSPRPTLTERDAAAYVGFSAAALRAWRRQGRGPAYVQVGRSIRYEVAALDAWLDRHRVATKEQP